tara:strand:+ start:9046 stop:9903 length:858 start_codon:yes stop_codon:yes gene_type:complete
MENYYQPNIPGVNVAADPMGRAFLQNVQNMGSNIGPKIAQARQRMTPIMQQAYAGDAMGMRGQLVSRAGLLGGALATIPGASEAMGEGRQLDAAAQVATGIGGGLVADRIARSVGRKNPLAGAAVQLGGTLISGLLGQGVGEVAENVKAGITGKDPAGKTSRAATRKQIEDDYSLMADLQAKYGAAALAPTVAMNKDLLEHSLLTQYQNDKRYEPLANRIKNADMVRQQALMNTQASNYAMLGTVATAGKLATGAQVEAGATMRTMLSNNPYAGSVMQAPNISFG